VNLVVYYMFLLIVSAKENQFNYHECECGGTGRPSYTLDGLLFCQCFSFSAGEYCQSRRISDPSRFGESESLVESRKFEVRDGIPYEYYIMQRDYLGRPNWKYFQFNSEQLLDLDVVSALSDRGTHILCENGYCSLDEQKVLFDKGIHDERPKVCKLCPFVSDDLSFIERFSSLFSFDTHDLCKLNPISYNLFSFSAIFYVATVFAVAAYCLVCVIGWSGHLHRLSSSFAYLRGSPNFLSSHTCWSYFSWTNFLGGFGFISSIVGCFLLLQRGYLHEYIYLVVVALLALLMARERALSLNLVRKIPFKPYHYDANLPVDRTKDAILAVKKSINFLFKPVKFILKVKNFVSLAIRE